MDSEESPQLAFVDGRDALAAVIVRPNEAGNGVTIHAYANGISKLQAARVLRYVAGEWEAEARNAN